MARSGDRRMVSGGIRRLLIWLVVAALVLPNWLFSATPVGAQGGSQVLVWYNNSDYTTFAGNETIEISIGSFDYVTSCGPLGGIPDSFSLRSADVYIIPSGKVPGEFGELKDVGGSANTIANTATAFTDRVIGFAKPAGQIPIGTYAIVYDECQNGVLDAYDAVFDPAFSVSYDPTVPQLPNNEMAAIKDRAAAMRVQWQATTLAMVGTFAVADAMDLFGVTPGGNPLASAYTIAQAVGLAKFNQSGYQDPKDSAITSMINMTRQYAAIAADPPDPAFAETVTLGGRLTLDPRSSDPLTVALVALGNTIATDDAQLAALLAAMEKYQGAQQAGPDEQRAVWAAAQARAIQTYASGQAAQLGDTDAALAALAAALTADTRPIDTAAGDLEAQRAAIVASGFTTEQLQALRALGLSDTELAQLRSDLANISFASDKADLLASIGATRSNIASTQQALNNFATAMAPIISELNAAGADDHPVVNAGGPYSGTIGAPVAFTGSATSTFPITSYAWDLDGDGDFDDGTTATPSYTYNAPFEGLVGLQVTNSAGRVGIDYAKVSVTSGNGRPQVTASSPVTGPTLEVGASQAFSVTASDSDGDPLTITWTLDGGQVGTGANYTFTATPYNLGAHTLLATVSDGKPYGTTVRAWSFFVLAPDADNDGWRANVDCDDNDSQAGYCPAQPVPVDPASLLVVTSTGDSDTCPAGQGQPDYTLRCAILAANAAGSGKTIAFNIPATDPGCATNGYCAIVPVSGGLTLPTLTASNTAIDGYTQPGARPNTLEPGQGTNAVIKINIQGQRFSTGRMAFWITGNNNVLRGLSITHFFFNSSVQTGAYPIDGGLYVTGNNNRFVGNYVGPLPDLSIPATKNTAGLKIIGNYNIVGGTTPAEINLISANTLGVYVYNVNGSGGPFPTGNIITGNLIGTNPAGTAPFNGTPSHQGVGVQIHDGRNTIVGGPTAAERNIISGNNSFAFDINGDGATRIQGNYVGLDITGTAAIGNSSSGGGGNGSGSGIRATGSNALLIKDNVISGNGIPLSTYSDGSTRYGGSGIHTTYCVACRIIGNRIGTNAAGTVALGNSSEGIELDFINEVTIGGTAPGEGNLISGNYRNGIAFSTLDSGPITIIGNKIGTDITGTSALGNGNFGVWLNTVTRVTVGGINPGEGNLIAYNGRAGIGSGNLFSFLNGAYANVPRDLFRGNTIRNNTGLGIDIYPENAINCDEPTTNGPNAYLHCPVIRRVTASTVSGTGPTGATVDLYLVGAAGDPSGHGEASAYLGSADVRGCGDTWTVTGLSLPPGAVVTATSNILSGANRGTSEFATNRPLGTNDPVFVPDVTAAANQSGSLGSSSTLNLGSFGDDCGFGPWDVSVDWGDNTTPTTFQAAAIGTLGSQAHTYANGGAKTVTVTVANTLGGSDSATFQVDVPTTTPGAPQNVVATPGNASATITWAAPASDGGAAIDRYDLSIAPTAGAPQTQQVTLPAALSATFTGLTNGTQYTVSITAHNTNGSGPAATAPVTPAAPVLNIASLGTTTTPEGGAAFPLTVTGGVFANGMVVRWNGSDRPTTFVSASELTAQIAAADVADSGTASVTIYDAANTATSNAATFTISNVAPSATFAPPATVAVGADIPLALTGVTDPSPADTTAGFTYAFDCGSGYGSFGAASTATCPTSAIGPRTVKGKVRDQDGGEREYTATVEIVALPATALAVGAASGTYGGNATLTATLTAASQPLAGKTVTFTLNGSAVGSATTDASGVATIASASLAGLAAGSYPSGVAAAYAGEANAYAGGVGSAALTVAPAPLTVAADSKSRLVGAANPAFTATYAGFVGNETTAVLGGALACTTTATIVSPVGTYPITCSGLTATNYALTYQPGTLTVAADGSATNADPVAVTYGAASATLTATVTASAAVNEGTVTFTIKQGSTVVGTVTSGTVANGAASASLALAGLDAGAYTLVADYSGGPNVAASSGSGTLTIAKAGQAITFGALADRQLGSGTFQVAATASSGLTVAFAASGACTVSGTTVTLTAVGTCTVTASQAGNVNYSAATPVLRSFQVTAAPPAQVTLTLSVAGSGTVLVTPPGTTSGGGTFPFEPNTVATLIPQPGGGQTFTGWTVDGVARGWANPFTITMNTAHSVQATFAATPAFPDAPSNRADANAIANLAARGSIRGYADGRYGPDEGVQRAQMAALIARATLAGPGIPTNGILTPPACLAPGTWDCEDWGNNFADRNGLNGDLWRNVGALQHYQVAFGYDGAACAARKVASPCYAPTAPVSYVETVVFITRAMIAKGYWIAQPGAPQPYAGVPAVFATEVATFNYYTQGAGGIPAPPSNWNAGATRGWFARALWVALDTYWGTDGTLPDNRNAGGYQP